MTGSIWDWSATASSNANSDGDVNWAEGQAPSTVNNSARVMMKRIKDLLSDLGGVAAASGTANALTVTTANGFSAYTDGLIISLRATATNSGASTLDANAVGDKPIVIMSYLGEADTPAAVIQENGIYEFVYSSLLDGGSGAFLLTNPSWRIPDFLPVGASLDFHGTTAPSGWLLCYGQAVSRTTYAALFSAIGTANGAGDGSTTFNVPDFRGRTSAGKDDMGGTAANRITSAGSGITGTTLGAAGGAETHALTSAQNGPHTHGVSDPGHSHAANNIGANTVRLTFESFSNLNAAPNGGTTSAATTGISIQSSGSGTAHNNTQPTIITNKIIKY